jgi:N-acetylmuramoyl-L-alanine amidase
VNNEYQYFSAVANAERVMVCNNANSDYVISICHNTFSDTTVNYTRVYFYYDHSEQWGDATHAAVEQAMETVPRNDGAGAYGEADYAILTGIDSDIPGIMVCASFFSNPQEEVRLNSNAYLENEAAAIYAAFTTTWQ